MGRNLLILTVWAVLLSCVNRKTQQNERVSTSVLNHAKKVKVQEFEEFQILQLPNQNLSIEKTKYILYEGFDLPDSLLNSDEYIKIRVPVKSLVSNSTTHLSMLESLGADHALIGFAQTQFISSQKIRKRVENGGISEVGNDSKLNMEMILNLNPELVLTSGIMDGGSHISQLKSLGIEVLPVADFAENSLLGKAEWIKVFGLLFGKSQLANDIFSKKVLIYDSLLDLVNVDIRPKVLSGTLYGGTWFMPGGLNYNSAVINDAGGEYLWNAAQETGWLNLDFEVVYEHAWDADLWIGAANFSSLSEMKSVDARYADFEPFKNKNVYTYTARVNEYGANDYFESGSINPERVLADHIKMIHPELLPAYELYYYVRLAD